MSKNDGKFAFIEKWKAENIAKIKLIHPNIDEDKLNDYLDKIIDKNFKDHECVIHNNHKDITAKTSLLQLTQFLNDTKPIIAGNGTLYKNQFDAYNPSREMLLDYKTTRARLKKERRKFPEDSYQYMVRDIGQDNVKRLMNSFYGGGLSKTSTFYNKYTGASIPATGQALISTSMTSFEQMMMNNSKFFDMDEFLLFVERVLHQTEYKHLDIIKPLMEKDIDIYDKAFDHLYDSFLYKDKVDEELIHKVLKHCTKEELFKLYFKNNFDAFLLEIPAVFKIIHRLVNATLEFRNPNEPRRPIKEDLDTVWSYMKEFVCHDFTVRRRIERDKFHKRKFVVAQDTDSSIQTIYHHIQLLLDNFVEDEVAAENDEELTFILVNIISYFLKQWTVLFLARYARDSNIPDEFAGYLDLKNEFFYPIFVATPTKKRYLTLMKLQEGKVINPPKIDTHGLDFAKAETSDSVKNFFDKLIKDEIMYAENIDVATIIRKLKGFEHLIANSILEGDTEYLGLKSVKPPEAYDEPMSEQGIKAVMAWNYAYPSMPIQLPDKILIVKLLTEKRKKFTEYKGVIPDEIYNTLEKNIFDSHDATVAKNGLAVIGIPQNVDKIPQWIIDIADISSMVNDNVSKFNPILISLGIVPLKSKANTVHMSNIVNL